MTGRRKAAAAALPLPALFCSAAAPAGGKATTMQQYYLLKDPNADFAAHLLRSIPKWRGGVRRSGAPRAR